MKKAIISGISGQDGSYLSEYLLSLGYEVHGIIRRNSENHHSRLDTLKNKVKIYYGDLTDISSLQTVFDKVGPDEIYNLGAQSHVRVSYDIPAFTTQTNAMGTLNMLEVYRRTCPQARFYQASSSEMFGNCTDEDGFQRETTPMHPVSPYGCSKLYGYALVRNYRKAYRLHATNGILFNHESPRRTTTFVTNKVVQGAVMIKKGKQSKLELGNLDSSRDWGHAHDYVRSMHAIINHKIPDDFVISTGISHSIKQLCHYVFNYLGLDYKNYVVQNKKFIRPEELKYLKGDSTKARTILGWKPTYTFETMLDEMIESQLASFKG